MPVVLNKTTHSLRHSFPPLFTRFPYACMFTPRVPSIRMTNVKSFCRRHVGFSELNRGQKRYARVHGSSGTALPLGQVNPIWLFLSYFLWRVVNTSSSSLQSWLKIADPGLQLWGFVSVCVISPSACVRKNRIIKNKKKKFCVYIIDAVTTRPLRSSLSDIILYFLYFSRLFSLCGRIPCSFFFGKKWGRMRSV